MKLYWMKAAAVFLALTLTAGCGCSHRKTQIQDTVTSVFIDENPIASYRIEEKLMVAVDRLQTYGFSVFHDEDAGVWFINRIKEKAAEPANGKRQPVQALGGDLAPSKERIFVNGRELPGYLMEDKIYISVERLGETVYSDLADYGISDYYMASEQGKKKGELILRTMPEQLPSYEDNIRKMKQEDIFSEEIIQELEGSSYTLLVKNMNLNRYRTKTLVKTFDRDGKVTALNTYFDVYGISKTADFQIDEQTDKIFFSGEQQGQRHSFSYDPHTSAVIREGKADSYEARCRALSGTVLWSQETENGLICVIRNGEKERIKRLEPNGGISDLSKAATDGQGFWSVSDCQIENGVLRFMGTLSKEGTPKPYFLNLYDGGVIVCAIRSGSLPVILDGVTIQGYIIDGKDAICIQDLVRCGFSVEAEGNTVFVKEMEVLENPQNMPLSTAGTDWGEAKITTTQVRFNGMTVPSYEGNGKQYVLIEDLCRFRTEYNDSWGYSDYNMRAEYGPDAIRIELFRLGPARDGEFDRLNALVSQEEIELYTESRQKEAPYFGARLEPERGVYAGMNADNLISEGKISCLLNYVEFDDFQTDFYSPNRSYVKNEKNISVVAWNLTDLSLVFENDAYIKKALDTFAAYHKPMIIRFGAEMNVSSLGDSPSGFVNAFRKIAGIVHKEYPQFAMMWSMNDLGALNKPAQYYYPGDEYVDWMGISSFMKKHFGAQVDLGRDANVFFMTGEFAYHTNTVKNILSFMEENGIQKPVAVSEGGTVTELNYPGGGEIRDWSSSRIRNMYWYLPMRYPQVKIIDYFNHDTPNESQTYDISFHSYLRSIFDEATMSGIYLDRFGAEPDFTFIRADEKAMEQKEIPLYGYISVPEAEIYSVSYILDGSEVIAECMQIPYRAVLNNEMIADGMHNLKIRVKSSKGEREKTYDLIKSDGKIKIE